MPEKSNATSSSVAGDVVGDSNNPAAGRVAFRKWFAARAQRRDVVLPVTELLIFGTAHAAKSLSVLYCNGTAPLLLQPPAGHPAATFPCSSAPPSRVLYVLRTAGFADPRVALTHQDYAQCAVVVGQLVISAAALLARPALWQRLRHPLLISTTWAVDLARLATAHWASPQHLVVSNAVYFSCFRQRVGYMGLLWRALVTMRVSLEGGGRLQAPLRYSACSRLNTPTYKVPIY